METKLCRICGKLTDNYVNIFKTEGLKVKLETCLPIVISKYSLLPDTTCRRCVESVETFYDFIKDCLQSLIILETQFDVHDSCLKSKRKAEKGTLAAPLPGPTVDACTQTEPESFSSEPFAAISRSIKEAERTLDGGRSPKPIATANLVGYEVSDDSNPPSPTVPKPEDDVRPGRIGFLHSFLVNRRYFDNCENRLVNEIAEKLNGKRKCEEIQPYRAKIFKYDANNRRKSRAPKRIDVASLEQNKANSNWSNRNGEQEVNDKDVFTTKLPQICLLCEQHFDDAATLAAHVFDTHGIDMAQAIASDTPAERKKKLPDLVKIADLKNTRNDVVKDVIDPPEEPPANLYDHVQQSSLVCGLCSYACESYTALSAHLETCRGGNVTRGRYSCAVCRFSDDNVKTVENHIVTHDTLLEHCRRGRRIFDPADYVGISDSAAIATSGKVYTCSECDEETATFESFKEFSTHRRCQHQIFHCDLCNKFYGRNSHLWKHVNRLHKGHPSVTCLLCNKTSASKYHLAQHFNKIHSAKSFEKAMTTSDDSDFLKKKFEAFDFQSVKQSFLKQELLEQEQQQIINSQSENSDFDENIDENNQRNEDLPKEVDISSNLYTNIITNYTPPKNEGEYKCTKCFRGFLRKNVLKKHKKNCRPKNQKDLLTRCKTCTRIFKDRQSLAKHLINYHTDYVCEICQQKFQSKCEIVSHIRFNHPKCHLYCYCGNILRNSSELTAHKKDHRNSFICHFCGDNLPTKIKLKMHILSLHRKILSLSCGICLKLFETQHILRDHVRLAHKERLKPLTSCTVCGKNYGSKWKTFDHLNKSHGRIFRPCRICLEVFNTENDLQDHYDSFHGENPKKISAAPAPKSDNEESTGGVNRESINETSPLSSEIYNGKVESGCDDDDETAEGKMSLLEKRLMAGKGPKRDRRPKNDDDAKTTDEGMQNTSKRTVYVNSDVPSRCEICLKTWPAKKHLWQHYIRCHKSVAATVCGICLKANDTYGTLQEHLRENHPTLLHGQGFGSNFICRICGRYHNASSKLKLHMAIHENFDWKILDDFENKERSVGEEGCDDDGDAVDKLKEEVNIEINYENLIEEVECSSESEKSASGSSSSEDTDEEDEEASEENSLESQMLRNMLQEKGLMQTNVYRNQSKSSQEVKEEITSESDDGETTNSSYKAVVKSEVSSVEEYQISSDEASNDSQPEVKTEEELNSAIQSICYEQVMHKDTDVDHDYSEMPLHTLNNHEIQSAVDSIL